MAFEDPQGLGLLSNCSAGTSAASCSALVRAVPAGPLGSGTSSSSVHLTASTVDRCPTVALVISVASSSAAIAPARSAPTSIQGRRIHRWMAVTLRSWSGHSRTSDTFCRRQ